MTPEGRVKQDIKNRLHKLQEKYHAYYHMPVQNGMGKPTLDFNPVSLYGNVCVIEAKSLGNDLTPRQMKTKREIEMSGTPVFMIDGSQESWTWWESWVVWALANPRDSLFIRA